MPYRPFVEDPASHSSFILSSLHTRLTSVKYSRMSQSVSQSVHSLASKLGAKLHLYSTPQEPGLPFNENQPSQTGNTQSILGNSKQEDEEYGRYQQELVPTTTHGLSSTKSCSLANTHLKPPSRQVSSLPSTKEQTYRSDRDDRALEEGLPETGTRVWLCRGIGTRME